MRGSNKGIHHLTVGGTWIAGTQLGGFIHI